MEFHAKQIAAPKYWEEFEDLCLDLFRRVWGDPTAQKNGRRGQPQNGTDICGRLTSGEVCGLQCKGKDSRLGAAVTEKELREEAEKAKSFQPRLSRWLLVTTGSKDGAIEATARLISEEHKDKGLFSVQVLAWEDLQSMISDYPEVMEKYYRDQAPATREMRENLAALLKRGDSRELQPELQTVQAGISDIRTQVNFLAAAISKDASLGTLSDPFDIALQARIDEARDRGDAANESLRHHFQG